MTSNAAENRPWYDGITRYQWLVLVIASLGWVFDVFEGQIFVASMNEAMPSLLPEHQRQLDPAERQRHVAFYNNVTFAAFLLGGALGGVVFGVMSDRIGRRRTMTFTILMYSLFTCFSAFSAEWWHMAGFRFLVAMGVGGEWAVASTLVAEVFPKRARAWSLGIFHASSVLGTYLAILAGAFIVGNAGFARTIHGWFKPWLGETMDPSLPWRLGFLVGVLPALLIIWIRRSLHEPEHWEHARTTAMSDLSKKLGSFGELFAGSLRRNTVVGVGLAAVGMATFWGAHIYGKDLMRRDIEPYFVPAEQPQQPRSAAKRFLERVGLLTRRAVVIDKDRGAHVNPILEEVASELAARWGEAATRNIADQARPAFSIYNLRGAEIDVAPTAAGFAARAAWTTRQPPPNDPPRILFESPDQETAERFKEFVGLVQTRINDRIKGWEMLGMFLVTTGGGLGLVMFGPLCERRGRRKAFLFYHVGGLIVAVLAFQLLSDWRVWLVVLPVFGFLTLGMHAGYAIYFPELFPTRLRGTGAGFCFNFGRVLAAPILFLGGWMQRDWGFTLEDTASLLSLLFLLGAALLAFAPETRGSELPE